MPIRPTRCRCARWPRVISWVDQDHDSRQVIAEVDFSSAPETLYPGAIYMLQAAPYQVESLDWDGRKAYVRPTRADYYTDAIVYTRLKILERFAEQATAQARVAHGEVHLVRRFAGYKKIRYYTHENIGYGNINLPDQEMHTTAAWWEIRPGELERALAVAADGAGRFSRCGLRDAPRRRAADDERDLGPGARGRRR